MLNLNNVFAGIFGLGMALIIVSPKQPVIIEEIKETILPEKEEEKPEEDKKEEVQAAKEELKEAKENLEEAKTEDKPLEEVKAEVKEAEAKVEEAQEEVYEKGGKIWFKEAIEKKAPYNLGGWSKSQSEETRRKEALSSRPKKWSDKKKHLSVARALQALANVTQDEETKKAAKKDADYFFEKEKKFSDGGKVSKRGAHLKNAWANMSDEQKKARIAKMQAARKK